MIDVSAAGTLPYVIALDWERKAVVVAIRGTASITVTPLLTLKALLSAGGMNF